MELLIWITMMLMPMQTTIFDFSNQSDISNWVVVDDVVMGGRSDGSFFLSEEGTAVFTGKVSLENNGGFSSVRYRSGKIDLEAHKTFVLRVKGDGKRYQFRVKSNGYDRHSYIQYFETSGEWQEIEIPMDAMYASFRGMRLNMENYSGNALSEISLLVGNKKAESFRLEIDWIAAR